MAEVAYWRTANTRPAVVVPLYLGTDPVTGDVRTIEETDVMSLIMRNGDAVTPTAQLRGPLEVITLDPPRVDEGTGAETSQGVVFKPEDGDFDEDGVYDVVFDLTDTDGDVETIPDRVSVVYQFVVGAKPGDDD